MMYIDNRVLIPFALPFVLLALTRLMWLFAGAEWSAPGPIAGICLAAGTLTGLIACVWMFEFDKKIGGFWVGGRR